RQPDDDQRCTGTHAEQGEGDSPLPHPPQQLSAPSQKVRQAVQRVVDTPFIKPLPEEIRQPYIRADKQQIIQRVHPPPLQQEGGQAAGRLLCLCQAEPAALAAVASPACCHTPQGNDSGQPLQQQFA